MKIVPTELKGSYMVEIEPFEDERGSFSRLWCKQEFKQHDIDMDVMQVSYSYTEKLGTVRGLHFQWPPSCEAKLVRCQRGRIFDVIIDLRPDSPTYTQHAAFELDSSKHNALYIPSGFAHGFQTLEESTEVMYMMSDYYRPDLQGGVRYNDPFFGISWPLPLSSISSKDQECPDFEPDRHSRDYFRVLQSSSKNKSSEQKSTD